MKAFIKIYLTLALAMAFLSCSSSDIKDSNSAEAAFKAAQQYEKDERYEDAIIKYKEVQNKHPYSRYAVEAKIHIADIQYQKESFIESQNSYQLVKDLHPKHERIDYVTFRLAMSYFKQLPGTIDRDLTQAGKAILYFDEVMTSYSTSQYAKEALERKNEALRMLADKEKYIADFYFKRDMYDSAFKRYEKILKTYPTVGLELAALFGAASSAIRNGDLERGKEYSSRLAKLYPTSNESEKVQGELRAHGVR